MSVLKHIREQAHQHNVNLGRRPKTIIFSCRKTYAVFLDEVLRFKSEAGTLGELNTKIREDMTFEGMKITLATVTYGGSFTWGFGE